jgi:hypothetical protein
VTRWLQNAPHVEDSPTARLHYQNTLHGSEEMYDCTQLSRGRLEGA